MEQQSPGFSGMSDEQICKLKMLMKSVEDNPQNDAAFVDLGKFYWQMGNKGAAISAYEKAAKINPDGAGSLLLEHSNAIMNFFNPDLLNP